MKNSIRLEIPLSGNSLIDDEFLIPPPCFYCGAPVDDQREFIWKFAHVYALQHWGINGMEDIHDQNQEKLFGKCTLKFPYCSKHILPNKTFNLINSIVIYGGLAVGTVLFILFLIFELLPFKHWFFLILEFGMLIIISLILFHLIGKIIKSIIVKRRPELKDYVSWFGHYGVDVGSERIDGGEKGIGPIRYFLQLELVAADMVQRFLDAYPQTIIVRGEELLKRSQ